MLQVLPLFLLSKKMIRLQITTELVDTANSLLQQVFNLKPTVVVDGVTTHEFSNRQYARHNRKYTLKVWAMIAANKPLFKSLPLKSKTNTINSIDPENLYQ